MMVIVIPASRAMTVKPKTMLWIVFSVLSFINRNMQLHPNPKFSIIDIYYIIKRMFCLYNLYFLYKYQVSSPSPLPGNRSISFLPKITLSIGYFKFKTRNPIDTMLKIVSL
jgi:hypothetical protein